MSAPLIRISDDDFVTTIAWPLALSAGAIGGSLATACMMPFVGISVLAALTMGRGQAVITVLGCWAVNQIIGFGLIGFPLDAHAVAWGAALGVATLASLGVARTVVARSGRTVPGIALAFAAAFGAYELLLFGFALVAGGLDTFTPAIVARLLANEAAWLVALGLLHMVLTRVAPRLFTTNRGATQSRAMA